MRWIAVAVAVLSAVLFGAALIMQGSDPSSVGSPTPSDVLKQGPGDLPPRARAVKLSGEVRKEGGVVRFARCGGGPELVVDDGAGFWADLAERLGHESPSVYVEIRGQLAEEVLAVQEVEVAVVEGHRCLPEPVAWDVRATGTEPFWVAEIAGDELRWMTMAAPEPVLYRRVEGRKADRFRADDGTEIRLEQTPKRCHGQMAASFFPLSVRLRTSEGERTGCARFRPPPGFDGK